jgi:hypothetical protein
MKRKSLILVGFDKRRSCGTTDSAEGDKDLRSALSLLLGRLAEPLEISAHLDDYELFDWHLKPIPKGVQSCLVFRNRA